MRTIIYGAGAIGNIIGARLFKAGKNVILIGRPAHVDAINKNGLKLSLPDRDEYLKIQAVKGPYEIKFQKDDIVLLAMKGQDTEDALKALKAVTKDVAVLCLQNGIRNESIAAKYFPRVYGAVVKVGALYTTPGEVVARWMQPGGLAIGKYPHGVDKVIEDLGADLRAAGFGVALVDDIMAYKWGKLVTNLGNAPSAITGVLNTDTQTVIKAAREEAEKVLAEAGIKVVLPEQLEADYPDVAPPLIPREGMNKAWNSTWQSLNRKTGSVETDYFNGEIIRAAEKNGHQAPINKKIMEICMDMAAKGEVPGKYTPAELRKILGV